MRSESGLAVKVGIFFTLAILIALSLSLQVGKSSFFSETYKIVANFKQVAGIDAGTKVSLRGIPVGEVDTMEWNSDTRQVRLVLVIEEQYKIPSDSTAKIQVSSLLGGNVIDISPAQEPKDATVLAAGDEIQTTDTPTFEEVMTTVSELSVETQDLVKNLNENQAEVMGKVREVIDENRADLKEASESFARVGPKVETLADRLNEMTEFMKGGEGTIGALYADKDLYNQLKSFGDTAEEITAQIKSGEGTLGGLIYRDDTLKEAKTVMEDLRSAAQSVEAAIEENREGLDKSIAALGEAGPKIEEAINNFNEISGKMNSTNGTLGLLINDPSLYQDAQKAVNQISDSYEGGEEQGVIRSFISLVFGAII